MGIRIRKRFGYGLVVDEGDSRVNWERIAAIENENLPEGETLKTEDYVAFCEGYTNGEGWSKLHTAWVTPYSNGFDFTSSVNAIRDEDGMADGKVAVLVTPPMVANESYQFDNLFLWGDFETHHPDLLERMEALVTEYRLHPHPFEPTLVDSATRNILNAMEARRFLRDGKLPDYIPEKIALRGTPYESLEELSDKARLLPPIEPLLYTEWLRVFNDLETVESIKPLAVTYFS